MESLLENGLKQLMGLPLPIRPSMLVPAMTSVGVILSLYYNVAYYRDYLAARHWRDNPDEIEVFDFIVGGGSAGAAVAQKISRHNSVLLLELGGDPSPVTYIPMGGLGVQRIPSADLMYETLPQNNSALALKNRVLFFPRGKDIGGTSNMNAMIYQRGNPQDYDNWANITGDSQWNYENLLPFFKKLEDYHGNYPNEKYHGRGGPMHVEKLRQTYMTQYLLKAAKEKGYRVGDLNRRQGEGFSELDVTMKNGLRWSTYPGYIEPILERKNLRIYRYSRVVKVHLSKERLAYGVTYYRHGQRRFVRARKEIILSGGAIDSPKLLLLSGIGLKSQLHSVGLKCRVNLPVGQNLQDHLYTLVGPFLVDSPESLIMDRSANLKSLMDFTLDRRGVGVSNGFSAVGYVSTSVRNDSTWPDIQYTMTPIGVSELLAFTLERISNVKHDVLHKYLSPYFGHDGNFILQTLVRPKSVGELRLASKDPFAKPIIQPNYLSHEDDIKALIHGTKIIVDIFENTTTYKAINARLVPKALPGCEKHKLKSDSYYECLSRHLTFTLYHPAGTVPMGKNLNDSRAVLDPQLRVLKTRGLRVMDASVMPVIINANTNIPSIMIGEVGAYLIRSHWARQYEICPRSLQIQLLSTKTPKENQCFYSRLT